MRYCSMHSRQSGIFMRASMIFFACLAIKVGSCNRGGGLTKNSKSVKLLDICSTSRDNLDATKGHARDLELAKRRGDPEAMKSKARDYSLIIKKATKDVKRQICKNNESADGDSSDVVLLLLETRGITISLLQSIFSYSSRQIIRQKSSKWFLASRLLEKRTIASKEEKGEDCFDAACLRVNVEELENGVESLFRHLIQCRVSLLNIAFLICLTSTFVN